MSNEVKLVSPFPAADYPLLWGWLREFPDCNFDDHGPRSYAEFEHMMNYRLDCGEMIVQFRSLQSDTPIGAVGYLRQGRFAVLHGVCFARSVHGSGLPFEALKGFLGWVFDQGVVKISAAYLESNGRVHRFFQKLGASEEGYLRKDAFQNGRLVDKRLVAFYVDEFRAMHGSGSDQGHRDASAAVPALA